MRMYDLIEKKKHGKTLSADELNWMIRGYTDGRIPDYQMAAFAMAVWFSSMEPAETAALTLAMAKSGDMVDLSRFGTRSVDKHSTGGVGDKTTLIVTPIAAALGCKVAKMSGRGLGHTGGTVDKLESIPGYRTTLSREEFLSQVEKTGVAVIGQSGNLAPADKKLYALRDVTATVDSIPLIASSIMSKKLAAGAHSIVLDVKIGSGAFMKTEADAAALAREMVQIGTACGRRMTALLTDMDLPLGNAVGNALEVEEAISVLRGSGPEDLWEVSRMLAAEMVSLALQIPPEKALYCVEEVRNSGAAWTKFCEWIEAQGGDPSGLGQDGYFRKASCTREIRANCDGYIAHMNAAEIGEAASILGAGRIRKEDTIDLAAGIRIEKKTGDAVHTGDVLATLYTSDETKLADGADRYLAALTFSSNPTARKARIRGVIRA